MRPLPFCRLQRRVVHPRPSIRLKTGPAMQPVMAISPRPRFASDTLAMKSPREFPHERIVKPRKDGGRPVIIPRTSNKSTMISQRVYTHTILMKKLDNW